MLVQQCAFSLLPISHLLRVLALPKIEIPYYNLTLTDWKICDLEPEPLLESGVTLAWRSPELEI